MDKYTLNFLNNNLNSVIGTLTKPQKKAVSSLTRQIFRKGTTILRHLAEDNGIQVKSQTRTFARHLENIKLEDKVDEFALKKAKNLVLEDTAIAYDLSDIAKEEAKVMENLSTVFDGSKRKPVNGFCLHGVGVKDILLKFQVHDADKDTTNRTRKNIILDLHKKFEGKGIWVLDRGNDAKHFFRTLSLNEVKFICRLRNNRDIILKNTGEKKKLKELKVGKHEVYLLNTNNNKVKTDIVYTIIIHKHLKGKGEMRLISNLPKNKFSSNNFVKKYLERWGVETKFRTIKTKFELEKIRVLSWNKFVNLIALVRLSMLISHLLYRNIMKYGKQILSTFYHVAQSFKIFIKNKALTHNPDAFIRFLGTRLPFFLNKKPPDPPIPSLFSQATLQKLSPS